MKACELYEEFVAQGMEMFCGVPDSLLKAFCACVTERAPKERHVIAANEGNALAIAAGYYMATGEAAVVYMQNSGLGNVVNPLLSLTDEAVYSIPALLLIGWRGEPGVHDEPQHVKQGELTLPLLDTLGVPYALLEDTAQVQQACDYMREHSKPYALVVRKGVFEPYERPLPASGMGGIPREAALQQVLSLLREDDAVVSTTGMISRELYENRHTHERDFLTVGSMGHASSIALGISLAQPGRRVYCMDGDGAMLMHLGGAAVLATVGGKNLRHVLLNNEAHDSVGAQPTIMHHLRATEIAKSLGYKHVYRATTRHEIQAVWPEFAEAEGPSFLEIQVACGARKDLGRPKERPVDNKQAFMRYLQS